MIISASRRTDIPSYYSDWFFNRIKEGYVLVRNPLNTHNISKINFSPDVVDGIVFWSKNPRPMLKRLNEIREYPYYFQFTLNSYETDIEANLPSKIPDIVDTFKKLSDKIGENRVIWRYDPILKNEKYTLEHHVKHFEMFAKMLHGYTKKCTVSFIDYYRSITKNIEELKLNEITEKDMRYIAKSFSEIGKHYKLDIDTCAETVDLSEYGIGHARCVDDKIFSDITGFRYDVRKDKNQRLECGCITSIDIGMYNTCLNACKYCYANHNIKTVRENHLKYNSKSPLLCSELTDQDTIHEKEIKSYKNKQIMLNI